MGNFAEVWKTRTILARLLFILVILYCVSSSVVLLGAVGLVEMIPNLHLNPGALVIFTVISYVFAILVSAYHLSTFLRRRKRSVDHSGGA
jgi:hypothetical protein